MGPPHSLRTAVARTAESIDQHRLSKNNQIIPSTFHDFPNLTISCFKRKFNLVRLQDEVTFQVSLWFVCFCSLDRTHCSISFVSLSSLSFSFNSTWQLFIHASVKKQQQQRESLSNTLERLADVRDATPATKSCCINGDDDDGDDCYYYCLHFSPSKMFWRFFKKKRHVGLDPLWAWFKAALQWQGRAQGGSWVTLV